VRFEVVSGKGKKIAISLFIIFNVTAILFSSSKPRPSQNPVERFFSPYLTWTRLNQNWPLFVPSPRKFAMKYRVEVRFKDGSQKVWRRPYPPNWDFFPRHLSYSFQKWDLASNYLGAPGPLWYDLANYIQRIYWDDANPPEQIVFIRSIGDWPPPNESGYVGPDESQLKWVDHQLFVYSVAEKRMQ
jgi:hypothetical protein